MKEHPVEDDPLWYKDAVIYELHVRAFGDSNADGIGDFKGLTEKLDYLEGLGITAVWLLPFYPSPLRDDGYDIADYFDVHADYGTLKDFKQFLRQAHKRGIRVITELVLNHTSNEHAWFQKARRAKPGTKTRDMYVWNETPDKYADARIIFKDFESSNWTWDAEAQQYFWHRFYSHQPDLNYESPSVQKAMFKVIDFWFAMGVDGLRLDAVPYLYEKEGTNCENLQRTHQYLKELRAHVDKNHKNKMFLAEANQWPEDAVEYLGRGDECHMAFHFPLMPRIFMSMHMEDSFPIIDILRTTPEIPQTCQWAIFLRNHDELTLEMVTDEERDYMYRMYARDSQAKINLGIRRRLAPLLGNNRRKIELVNILLFSFPGTPVLYYGDEIGMGDNYYLGDRNGVRTPMQWTPDRNAGFSSANPHRLFLPIIIDPEYHYESINVENQDANLSSLLWWMRRVIDMRKRYKAFGRGKLEMLYSDNPKVLTFLREYEDERILVVANLSRFSQVVTLYLNEYEGYVPEEVFSHNNFPLIGKRPYTLTLGPYNHYWLLLKKKEEGVGVGPAETIPEITARKSWESILSGKTKERFEENILPRYLRRCRWFAAKSRTIRRVNIIEDTVLDGKPSGAHVLLLELSYSEGQVEHYCLPISFSWENTGPEPYDTEQPPLPGTICKVSVAGQTGVVYDGTYDERLQQEMLSTIEKRRKIQGRRGVFIGSPSKSIRQYLKPGDVLPSRQLKAEQSNTSILYGEKLFMKLYRRLDEGTNPELEVMRFLSDRAGYTHIPPYAGAIEYRRNTGEPVTVALLQGFVENAGNAWSYTLDMMVRYFEQVLQRKEELTEVTRNYPALLDVTLESVPPALREIIGELYLEQTALLGRRTAEMHLALGSSTTPASFAPEPFTLLYQRSMYQSMQSLVRRTFQTFSRSTDQLPEAVRSRAKYVLGQESKILALMKNITGSKIPAMKIRIHGDYHLGQVLYTGKDFVIMDFEGEPARALSERKLKYSPFKDVAGMIRSYHYAGFGSLFLNTAFRPEDMEELDHWIEPWYHYTAGIFLRSYLDTVKEAPFVPGNREDLELLLQVYLLEKAVYELGYELNNRPDWVSIPLKGIDDVIRGTM